MQKAAAVTKAKTAAAAIFLILFATACFFSPSGLSVFNSKNILSGLLPCQFFLLIPCPPIRVLFVAVHPLTTAFYDIETAIFVEKYHFIAVSATDAQVCPSCSTRSLFLSQLILKLVT